MTRCHVENGSCVGINVAIIYQKWIKLKKPDRVLVYMIRVIFHSQETVKFPG